MKTSLILVIIVVILALGAGYYFFVGNDVPMVTKEPGTKDDVSVDEPVSGSDKTTETVVTKSFTSAEVALHSTDDSCFTIVRGTVYDLTSWIGKHPGGDDAIRGLCGTDGTEQFVNQHGGSGPQETTLAGFEIGVLAN